ncbi:argininosuccinate lyase [Jannaschia pohangensis]|uniref:Uncharacterized protein n=1 Tax=Jannaschia pohangensis TaxID=390807 RepID=A0A1I3M346_9RHOB|nr:argininosuccinate lyase [Jannaschia pohangensis]SFI91434.1 hypothetical protein SAMN04488095_1717 [Jannaschia pohangensis]
MTRTILLPLTLVALLSACGVDGEPVPPSEARQQTGLSVSGTVEVGVSRRIQR